MAEEMFHGVHPAASEQQPVPMDYHHYPHMHEQLQRPQDHLNIPRPPDHNHLTSPPMAAAQHEPNDLSATMQHHMQQQQNAHHQQQQQQQQNAQQQQQQQNALPPHNDYSAPMIKQEVPTNLDDDGEPNFDPTRINPKQEVKPETGDDLKAKKKSVGGMPKRQRVQYSAAEKLDILEYARVYSSYQASNFFNVDRKSIREWKVKEPELRQRFEKHQTFDDGTQRRKYSTRKKLEVVEYAKKHTIHKASREFDVDRRCVRAWKAKEDELRGKLILGLEESSSEDDYPPPAKKPPNSDQPAWNEFEDNDWSNMNYIPQLPQFDDDLQLDNNPRRVTRSQIPKGPCIRVRRNAPLGHFLDRSTIFQFTSSHCLYQMHIGCMKNGKFEYVACIDSLMLAVQSPVLQMAMDSLAESEEKMVVFDDTDGQTVLRTLNVLFDSTACFNNEEQELFENVMSFLHSLGIQKEQLKVDRNSSAFPVNKNSAVTEAAPTAVNHSIQVPAPNVNNGTPTPDVVASQDMPNDDVEDDDTNINGATFEQIEMALDPFEIQGLSDVPDIDKPLGRSKKRSYGSRYSSKDIMPRHIYKCAEDGCDYTTTKPAYWYKHKKRHDTSRNTKLCTDCGKEFADLYNHQRYYHKKDKLPTLECPYETCNYKTHIPSHMYKHKRRHEPPTIPCPYCSMLFHIKGDIKRHIATSHTNDEDKKYRCEICGKGFVQLSRLQKHTPIHAKIRDKVCTVCGSMFYSEWNLREHMRHVHPDKYVTTRTCSRMNQKSQMKAFKSLCG